MRREFDLDPNLIYLNSANQSILPRVIRERLAAYTFEYERNPTAGLDAAWGRLWQTQKRLAGFLGASPHDLFLRANVTSILNTFLLGLPLPEGSEILVGELEYGAIVNVCRLRAARERLRLRVIKMPGTVAAMRSTTAAGLLDTVVSQIGPDTRLVLLSHVLGGTGLVMPIAEIAAETRRRGVFFVVDGAYAPGALAVDFARLGDVDGYGCSLYKWMLGPKGTAFGWVSPRMQPLLQPQSAGWTTFDTFGPFAAFGEGNRFQESFLMAGCHDFAPFRAIDDTLDFWERLGADAIRRRMAELRAVVEREVARSLGWRKLSLDGPMVAYRLPADHPRRFEGVQLNTFRLRDQWHVVFSPHVHNDEEEIARAVTVIASP